MTERLRIGEVARACGVSSDTVRHYEAVGVIAPAEREANGYRSYTPSTIERIQVVRRALGVGFTLEELSRIFRQRASGRPPCREVRALAAKKLADLDRRIEDLQALRSALAGTLDRWDERLAVTAPGAAAHLIESLTEWRSTS